MSDSDQRTALGMRVTTTGALINAALLLLKLGAAILGNSQAMMADAMHTLSDFASDFAVLIGIRLAGKPMDADHAYGHGKYETVTAALIGVLLFWVALGIGWQASAAILAALRGAPLRQPSPVAFWVALASIALKEGLYRWTHAVGQRTRIACIVANAWHHRSDALSSVATAVGIGAAVFLGNEWVVLDPIAAIAVCFLLLKIACAIIGDQIGSLTDKSLPGAAQQEIEDLVHGFPALSYPHNLRTRTVGRIAVIDLHVRVDPAMSVADAHEVVSAFEARLRERFGHDTIATVHIEPLPSPAAASPAFSNGNPNKNPT